MRKSTNVSVSGVGNGNLRKEADLLSTNVKILININKFQLCTENVTNFSNMTINHHIKTRSSFAVFPLRI